MIFLQLVYILGTNKVVYFGSFSTYGGDIITEMVSVVNC